MSETPKQTRTWKQVGIFNSFEDADSLRKELLNEDKSGKLEVRVKRCGQEGAKFKVKVAHPIVPSSTKKEKRGAKRK